MNRTLKESHPVRRYHYETHKQSHKHLEAFLNALQLRSKAPQDPEGDHFPYEHICKSLGRPAEAIQIRSNPPFTFGTEHLVRSCNNDARAAAGAGASPAKSDPSTSRVALAAVGKLAVEAGEQRCVLIEREPRAGIDLQCVAPGTRAVDREQAYPVPTRTSRRSSGRG